MKTRIFSTITTAIVMAVILASCSGSGSGGGLSGLKGIAKITWYDLQTGTATVTSTSSSTSTSTTTTTTYWSATGKMEAVYDSIGNLVEIKNYRAFLDTMDPSSKMVCTYDKNGNLTERMYYEYAGMWYPRIREQFGNDASGRVENYIIAGSVFNDSSEENINWYDDNAYNVSYDENGKISTMIESQFSNNAWISTRRYVADYTGNDLSKMTVYKNEDTCSVDRYAIPWVVNGICEIGRNSSKIVSVTKWSDDAMTLQQDWDEYVYFQDSLSAIIDYSMNGTTAYKDCAWQYTLDADGDPTHITFSDFSGGYYVPESYDEITYTTDNGGQWPNITPWSNISSSGEINTSSLRYLKGEPLAGK